MSKNLMGINNNVERQIEDYYATDSKAAKYLVDKLNELNDSIKGTIWESACGEGHLSKKFIELGFDVYSTDKIDRGYCDKILDFLRIKIPENKLQLNIITNPPYSLADDFIKKSLDMISDGYKVCMFLQIRYLEGQKRRKEIYDINPPKYVFVSSSRIICSKNGTFTETGSTVCYAWFVWEKGFKGKTQLNWIN